MTHCAYRSRVRVGHQTATGPATPTRSHERWGRVEALRTALGEALVMHRRTRVRFPPPPPPRGLGEMPGPTVGEMRPVSPRAVTPASSLAAYPSSRRRVPRPHLAHRPNGGAAHIRR